jgi:hypothetical protein
MDEEFPTAESLKPSLEAAVAITRSKEEVAEAEVDILV